jgi:hypothetical protein
MRRRADAPPSQAKFEILLARIQSPALLAVARLWSQARGARRMPCWSDLMSPALSPYSKIMWGYNYDSKTGDFTGSLMGRKLEKWVGEDFYHTPLNNLHPIVDIKETSLYLTKIVTASLAFRSSGRLFTVDDLAVTGERIALPLAEDGKTSDAVVGASDFAPPPLLRPGELVYENVEWYEI